MVTTQLQTIGQHGIDRIDELLGYEPEASELHHHLYNEDYFIIGYYNAEQFLGDEVFSAINEIKDYEQDNFGEVTTDFSDSEKVVNMYAYIKGEELLNNCQTLQDNWDSKLTDKQLKQIKLELQEQI